MNRASFLLLLAAAFTVVSARAAEEKFRFERPLMGTRFRIICCGDDRAAAGKAAGIAFGKAEQVNAAASDYLPESELSLLSSKPVGSPVPLSPLLYDLLDHSRCIAEATDGAFDPTLGPLTKLWRRTRDRGTLPSPSEIEAARAGTGWRHFTLDPEARTITLHRPGMAFDLGAVAKGHVADLMLESLAASGITRALVAAGGEIRMGDPPTGSDGWRVALQTFDPARPDEAVTLSNCAVSTSGDLHQSVEIDGVRYSHIVSPSTGLGLTRRVAAIVIANEAKLSDAISTAACVLGPDAGGALRHLPGIREVRFLTPQESLVLIHDRNPTNH